MTDLIDRLKTIEHIKKRLVETALNNIGFNEDVYLDIADHRIETWVNSIPPAQPEHDDFLEFLWNTINPNEMEHYLDMYNSKGVPENVLTDGGIG